MLKVSLKYGLVCGPLLILVVYWTYLLGSNPFNPALWIVDLIVFGLFSFFAGYEYRNYQNDGEFHFWQGMSIGFTLVMVATLVFGTGLLVWLMNDPRLVALDVKMALEIFEKNKDVLGEFMKEEDVVLRTPFQIASRMSLQNNLLSGFVVAPIVAIILRKKPKA